MPPELHFDLAQIDFEHIVADHEGIRQVNLQRYEMEQLDAVVYLNLETNVTIGYKDVRPDEFWVRGHMPGYPLLPGILMCEAAAQLCSFFSVKKGLLHGDFIGFGGMEHVRFRNPVHPGERLVLVAKVIKYNRRQMIYNVQGFVGTTMVFHGDVIGMCLTKKDED
jgi:3-hydroxyacyl-[acyl-carrier-protein] dehydratase